MMLLIGFGIGLGFGLAVHWHYRCYIWRLIDAGVME